VGSYNNYFGNTTKAFKALVVFYCIAFPVFFFCNVSGSAFFEVKTGVGGGLILWSSLYINFNGNLFLRRLAYLSLMFLNLAITVSFLS